MVRAGAEGCASYASATFEDAMKALNGLQTNASVLMNKARNPDSNFGLRNVKKYLERSGMSLDNLDNLSVIHVAGTKGKGSSCVFTESLLQSHGVKTGLFTSPHLISVRERMRINGKPIDENVFAKYFFKIYRTLEMKRENANDMPPYFTFLTIMMFHLFLESSIDVAIIEVGIGGEYDCTNVLRRPVCVGITSLGLDHTSLLGKTMTEIAYQKSGIFKPGSPAFSSPQPDEATRMLEKRAREKGCRLSFVGPLESHDWKNGKSPILGIGGEFQSQNASLAIHLASTWLTSRTRDRKDFSLDLAASALSTCRWPGRSQFLRGSKIDFYLDGAHTVESIESCVAWFRRATISTTGKCFLVFNMTGDRDSVKTLTILRSLNFRKAYFVPNVAGTRILADQVNNNIPEGQQLIRCRRHCDIWGDGAVFADNVSEAIEKISNENNSSNERCNVLVTGSLHLVGAALAVLDPDLTMSTKL